MGESAVLMADDGNEDYIACELCRETLQDLSVADRQAHYEAHFNKGDGLAVNEFDAQLAVSLAQESSPNRRGAPPSRQNSIQPVPGGPKPRETVFWHPACSSPPPSRIMTPGIIPLLDRALQRPGSGGGALCVPLMSHFGTELWDLGWGCGYRNFLMACSALAAQDARPEYRDLLMNDPCGPPGVRNLQLWIEDAWRRGYDSHGAAQLRNRLAGTRKWIGTAELYVALTSRGIPARLVDFPKNGYAHVALIQWLRAYFTESSNHLSSGSEAAPGVYMSSKMPVVLQHRGHSRTVVGLEFTQSGETNVLIYDPAWRPGASLRKAALKVHAASFSPSGSNTSPESEHHHRRNRSPTKAKEFFKRVIKRRSRTPVDEQASKRVRGGSAEPDDWVGAGEEKGQGLGGPVAEDQRNKDSSFRRKASTGTVDENAGRQLYEVPPDATQGLDLGRVLSAFRVTPSQLSKKDQYQVLWFPMTAPLTDSEREACKVVRSERITISPVPKQ